MAEYPLEAVFRVACRRELERQRLSHADLADRLRETVSDRDWPPQKVQKILAGDQRVRLEEAQEIATALRVPLFALIGLPVSEVIAGYQARHDDASEQLAECDEQGDRLRDALRKLDERRDELHRELGFTGAALHELIRGMGEHDGLDHSA